MLRKGAKTQGSRPGRGLACEAGEATAEVRQLGAEFVLPTARRPCPQPGVPACPSMSCHMLAELLGRSSGGRRGPPAFEMLVAHIMDINVCLLTLENWSTVAGGCHLANI